MIRTFLALELPDALKSRLAGFEREFSHHASVLKWPAQDLLHITLRFLGGVPEDRMPAVMEAAEAVASQSAPFTLSLSGIGAFPGTRRPRVIWVGLHQDSGYDALLTLFADLEECLTARGFPPEERAFSPHITLARTRDTISEAERRELGARLTDVAVKATVNGITPVDRLTVMRSDLARSGPAYTPLARYPLLGASVEDDNRRVGRAE
jgi:2'-5' RNA ligase